MLNVKGMKKIIMPVLLLLPSLAAAQSAQPRFAMDWPLKCIPNVDCFIDRYPDLNAGEKEGGSVDYGCGKRTQDGQTATEVIFTDTAHAVGQQVVAAAAGRVILVQNKVTDTKHMHPRGKYACGNEVRIRHIGDYETRYCHMMQGSVSVEAGQVVEAGTPLGKTGSSGATSVPKFAFYVYKGDQPLDPFSNQLLESKKPCFTGRDRSLWKASVPYLPAGVMTSGFARAIPRPYEVEKDVTSGQEWLSPDARQISAWVRMYGIQSGDKETFSILTPKDTVFFKRDKTYGKDFPYWFTAINAPAPKGLQEGRWQAIYTLVRDGEEVLRHSFFTSITAEEPAHEASATTEVSPTTEAEPVVGHGANTHGHKE